MPLVLSDIGVQKVNNRAMQNGTTLNVYYGLFTNNFTPVRSHLMSSYTEGAWAGYARVLTASWTNSTVIANVASSSANNVTFTVTGTVTSTLVYGYFAADAPSGGNLLWAELFPVPLTMHFSTDVIVITPTFTLYSQYP